MFFSYLDEDNIDKIEKEPENKQIKLNELSKKKGLQKFINGLEDKESILYLIEILSDNNGSKLNSLCRSLKDEEPSSIEKFILGLYEIFNEKLKKIDLEILKKLYTLDVDKISYINSKLSYIEINKIGYNLFNILYTESLDKIKSLGDFYLLDDEYLKDYKNKNSSEMANIAGIKKQIDSLLKLTEKQSSEINTLKKVNKSLSKEIDTVKKEIQKIKEQEEYENEQEEKRKHKKHIEYQKDRLLKQIEGSEYSLKQINNKCIEEYGYSNSSHAYSNEKDYYSNQIKSLKSKLEKLK